MEITEEQRKRAETNRLAALAKRKATAAVKEDAWKLFKCRKISPEPGALPKPENLFANGFPNSTNPYTEKFRVRLEVCSPDSFSITPEALADSPYPGETECLQRLSSWLAFVVPSHHTQNQSGGMSSVYKLRDYDMVLKCLKKFKGIELQEIPWRTLNVVQKLSHSFVAERWIPCMPEHLSDDDVDALIRKLPKILLNALMPFQLDGVRFGLRRGGCCLIADEMGLGKTIQAIAIACCFMNEGPLLVVCPAILRFSWAEELERWLPFCLPADIHLVFGHRNNPAYLTRCPRVVVISYTMLNRLRKSMLDQEWALLIVDESHHLRSTKKTSEPEEIRAVLDMATKVKRKILLSGTPSLSRPGLLGKNKYEFAKTYCAVQFVHGSQGKIFRDFSKGIRLEELNVLLKQTVMIRRLKEHVLIQLPPKRRQIIRLMLKRQDIILVVAAKVGDICCTESRKEVGPVMNHCTSDIDADGDGSVEIFNECDDNSDCHRTSRQLSDQELGIAKLSGFREWLSIHPIVTESECARNLDMDISSHKMIIFAHHLKVLDGIQEFACEKGIGFVRIDGHTLPRDKQSAVQAFRSSAEVKIAIIGITAGGVGLDFSLAQNVVFLEMPKSASDMLQAEDRAHRRGQTNAVNIYIFCAKDSSDELRWQNLNKSLPRVSAMMNGKYDAVKEIAVERVSDLGFEGDFAQYENSKGNETGDSKSGASGSNPVSKTDNTTGENGLSETAVCNELIKVESTNSQSTAINLMRHIEMCKGKHRSEKQVEADPNSSTQTDSIDFEVDRVSDVEMVEDSVTNGRLEDYTSEVLRSGSSDVVSTQKLDEASDTYELLEHAALEGILLTEPTISQNISVNSREQAEKMYTVTSEKNEDGPVELIKADASSVIAADSLRFELSQYTGRVHLYTCITGKDSRPRPLFENFRPEELESLNLSAADISKKTDQKFIKENPAYKDVLLAFIKEWNNLTAIERKKLLGKPLQLPLSVELCYLKDSINHGNGGLLKGGSKRRATPLYDISHPLPANAIWKKISLCSGYGRKEKEYIQGWTMTGEPLCKLCQTPCKGKLAKTPEFFEDLFCNLGCFEEFRIRTSQRSLREALFQIEHGICTVCNLDCHKLVEYIRPLSVARRREYIEKVAPKVASHKKLLDKLVYEPSEGNAWHADHKVPVYQGGGECKLENMRTLCVACHSEVTVAQCAERRLTRIKAKKELRIILKDLKDGGKMEHTNSDLEGREHLDMEENTVDDELLIIVPGSAYCSGKRTVTESNEHKSSSNTE